MILESPYWMIQCVVPADTQAEQLPLVETTTTVEVICNQGTL